MQNFSPKLEDQSDSDLKSNINTQQPNFASLSSDELTRRSLDKLQKTMVDLDNSNKKFIIALGLFAIIQIVIAGFALVLDIVNSPDKKVSIFIGVAFIIILVWLVKEGDKIMKK